MRQRASRAGWPALLLAAMLVAGLVGLTYLFGRWQRRIGNPLKGLSGQSAADSDRGGVVSDGGRRRRDGTSGPKSGSLATGLERLPGEPRTWNDPRLEPIRQAAMNWGRSRGPGRTVVDQVCLVPDVRSFFEAIAAWDERHFFPILIDEPAWTLPFLRAFRPSRVVRYVWRGNGEPSPSRSTGGQGSTAARMALWQAAIGAVARAWSDPSMPEDRLPPGGSPPRGLGPTPPGLVLTAPDSPMLAGAVALAAGRFQPLVRVEPSIWSLGDPRDAGRVDRLGDVLTLAQAVRFVRRLEARVAAVTPHYDHLGDDCDFLTIAGDWPYRYRNDVDRGAARGIHALDDLIGRELAGEPEVTGLDASRRRWAFAGRLLGDPAASVARAMAALFLQPDASLLWDTYEMGGARSAYSLLPLADQMSRSSTGPGRVFLGAGPRADLVNWHRFVDPSNRFGFVWINSSGTSKDFSISGGPGRPADVPGGFPRAVVMIHSYSVADLDDPDTIAARWLARGAFVYFGSINEPFLQAFRSPRLAADLLAAELPMAAALRQLEFEPYGRPWRLIYLGDPLYRLTRLIRPSGDGLTRLPTGERPGSRTIAADRLRPDNWAKISASYASWPAEAIAVTMTKPGPAAESSDSLLRWSLDAAIFDLVHETTKVAERPSHEGRLAVLRRIRRDRLDRSRRPIFDDVLIDALSETGDWEEMHARLARIPDAECGPRVWQALEAETTARLAQAAMDRDPVRGFNRALEVWDSAIRLAWPARSDFPAQLTQRVAGLAQFDASQRLKLWLDRLRLTGDELAAMTRPMPHAAVVAAERTRVESQLGHGR